MQQIANLPTSNDDPTGLDADGNCTACGLAPVLHIRHGVMLDPAEAHRGDVVPAGFYPDETAVA